MKIGVLTSVETRHRYFANVLRERLPIVAVGYETTGYSPARTDDFDLTPDERAVVAHHFDERDRQEGLYFGGNADFVVGSSSCAAFRIGPSTLNSDRTVELLASAGVDALAVFGTNLITEPLLGRFAGRIINMHLGLSPYYRGTATNFYPLLNEEPQYVGATIHLIDKGIDSGPILEHRRPRIVADDGPHTIGCKAILAGIEGVIAAFVELGEGKLKPVEQWNVPDARLYLRKDYHPRQIAQLYEKLDQGMIRRYVERADGAADPPRLIE